jgi:hypothetical protein
MRLRRKRAICPLRSAVSNNSPIEPALSKSSLWSFVGNVFHCMIKAAPASQDTPLFHCQSCFAGHTLLRPMRHLVEIIGKLVAIVDGPLLVVGEHGEAVFELLKFTNLVWSISSFDQFGVFSCFRTIAQG